MNNFSADGKFELSLMVPGAASVESVSCYGFGCGPYCTLPRPGLPQKRAHVAETGWIEQFPPKVLVVLSKAVL